MHDAVKSLEKISLSKKQIKKGVIVIDNEN